MTTPAALRELAPCPFCGGEPELQGFQDSEDSTHWSVKCKSCGALSGEANAESTPDQEFAIAAWNARTQLRTAASESGPSEVVAYQWFRNGKPTGGWFDGVPTERQLQAQKQCTGVAEWAVKYAYSHPPEVARDAGRLDYLHGLMRGVDLYNALYPHYDLDTGNIREAIDAATSDAALRARAVG